MIENWINQFHDTATFISISISRNSFGQETKTETPLYTNIRCSLIRRENQKFKRVDGQSEQFQNMWRCDVEKIYNGAKRGDRVVINGDNYIITKKEQATDFDGDIVFYYYWLKELE